jgi:maltose O-acetyltransferase
MPQSEKEKMLAGELYRSTDCELQGVMAEAQRHLRCLNAIPNEDSEQRFAVLRVLLREIGSGTQIKSPFACDYGAHIRIGRNGFVNHHFDRRWERWTLLHEMGMQETEAAPLRKDGAFVMS